MAPSTARAIVIHAADNVATALAAVAAGTHVTVRAPGRGGRVLVHDAIAAGHKFSLGEIRKGERVVKYGQPIGRATADIGPGRHVHVHNVESERGRGDRAAREA